VAKIVFDIETIGENFDELDETTQEMLLRWVNNEQEIQEIKNGLGFSPLTGQIVAIGVMDVDDGKSLPAGRQGAVYYQDLKNKEESEHDGVKLKPMSEPEMLEKFWDVAKHCSECISFNGRAFDVPFLMVRSAIHKIRPPINLMPPRYSSNATHIDLMDQLTFYGSVRKKGTLHLWCRAFGITSPKADGVTGDDVGRLFSEAKYREIAQYNVGDLRATRELYKYWNDFMRF